MSISIDSIRHFARQAIPTGDAADQVLHLNGNANGFTQVAWQTLGSRSHEFKQANRQIRQELMDSLRTMLGGAKLDTLPKALLDQLKLKDFDVDSEGRVHSDRPLTMRRIVTISKAIVEWQNTCRHASEHVATSAAFLNHPDPRRAEAQLARLFDSRRPLPANLTASTLERCAHYMFGMGFKPFQARLALACLSQIKSETLKVPSGRTPAARLLALAESVAKVIAPKVRAFGVEVRLFKEGLLADPPADPNASDLYKDGVSAEGVGAQDFGDVYKMVMLMLRQENTEVDALFRSAGEQDYAALVDMRDEKFNALMAISMEKMDAQNRLNDPNLAPAERPGAERELERLEALEFSSNVAVTTLSEIRGIVQQDVLDPLNVEYNNPHANALTQADFAPMAQLFNRMAPKDFSAEQMFVRNGKPGIDGFDAEHKVQKMFKGIDRKTFAQRANKIAASHAKLVVLEEMMKQKDPGEHVQRDFENDYSRENLVARNGARIPNRETTPMSEVNDAFAQQLRRKDGVRYADLTQAEKNKIMLMKSMLHQKVETIPFFAVTEAMTPNGDRQTVNSVMMVGQTIGGSKNISRFSFDDDGGMTVSVFRTNTCSQIGLGFNGEGNENGEIVSDHPIRATTRIDLHIPAEEVNRLANLDWSRLDIEQVRAVFDAYGSGDHPVPNFYENFPENHIPEPFRINLETSVSVSYEITD